MLHLDLQTAQSHLLDHQNASVSHCVNVGAGWRAQVDAVVEAGRCHRTDSMTPAERRRNAGGPDR
jgi:hypothetical protein